MPIFRKGAGPYAFAEAMTGVRLGERLLHIGAGDPALFAALAAKAGLTGRARAVVESDDASERMKGAAARAGVLVEVAVANDAGLPEDEAAFDVVILDATGGLLLRASREERGRLAAAALRALRPRGRAIVVEGERPRSLALFALFRGQPQGLAAFAGDGGGERLLREAGFHPVRLLAEHKGQRFAEGWKRPE